MKLFEPGRNLRPSGIAADFIEGEQTGVSVECVIFDPLCRYRPGQLLPAHHESHPLTLTIRQVIWWIEEQNLAKEIESRGAGRLRSNAPGSLFDCAFEEISI